MVGTITPLVQEARDNGRRLLPHSIVVVFVLSSLAGGVALVAGAQAIRALLDALVPALLDAMTEHCLVVLAVVGAYALVARASGRLWLPMFDRQVPVTWRWRRPARASMLYSFLLGIGIVTRVNSPAVYLVPAAALLAPTWNIAIIPALAYAFARASTAGLISLVLAGWYKRDVGGLLDWFGYQRLIWTTLQGILISALVIAAPLALA